MSGILGAISSTPRARRIEYEVVKERMCYEPHQ